MAGHSLIVTRVPSLLGGPMLRFLTRLILGLAVIAACFGGWYVVYRDAQAKAQAAPKNKTAEVLAVETVIVQVASIGSRIELVGSLTPLAQVVVRPRVGGYVRSLSVDLGDAVEEGAEIARLDDDSQSEAVALAEATLDVAKAQLQAQATERELSEKTLARQKNLAKSGAGTPQDLEQSQAALEIAQARVELERAKVAQANADLLRAKLDMEELRLVSPIKGVVADRMIDVGNLAAPDAPLLRIVDLSTVRTTVHVIERDYRLMRGGLEAEVRVDAYPNVVFQGKVSRVAPVLDEVTRTADVRIDIPNPDRLLKPGMYTRVSLRSGTEREGLVIPVAALLDGQRPSVMIVEGTPALAQRRMIEIGATEGDLVEVTQGLVAGDQVVTLGNRLVTPGQAVVVIGRKELAAGH